MYVCIYSFFFKFFLNVQGCIEADRHGTLVPGLLPYTMVWSHHPQSIRSLMVKHISFACCPSALCSESFGMAKKASCLPISHPFVP